MEQREINMGKSRVIRGLIGAAIFCGVVWFLYVEILASHGAVTLTRITVPSTGSYMYLKFSGRKSHSMHHKLGLNYVSKRRVPNGPDPIHNRRASQARQPPSRY